MDWVQLGLCFLAFLLVLLNGFFVAAEFAIVKVRPTQVEGMLKAGSRLAKTADKVVRQLDESLSATQLGITIASLGLGWVGERAVARLLEPVFHWFGITSPVAVHGASAAIAFTIISFLHIVLGELAPKTLAIRKPLGTTLWTAVPLRAFYLAMWPAIRLLNGAAGLVLRLFGLDPTHDLEHAHSPEELELIVRSSAKHGLLNDQERKLLENVLDFSERYVHEIMAPRPDMVCLYTALTLAENVAIVLKHQHTRYPLAVADKDQIIGMIHVKDLIEAGHLSADAEELARVEAAAPHDPRVAATGDALEGPRLSPLEAIKRPVVYVPEVTTIDKLLRVFQKERVHMAIAVDEYGGIAGLVTLEDVLEELVGEIRDEFDVEEVAQIQRRPNGEWMVAGGLRVVEVAERLAFPAEDATVDTIGGYVVQLLGRLPKVGDSVLVGDYRAEVSRMVRHRVTYLRFRPLRPGAPDPARSSGTTPRAATAEPDAVPAVAGSPAGDGAASDGPFGDAPLADAPLPEAGTAPSPADAEAAAFDPDPPARHHEEEPSGWSIPGGGDEHDARIPASPEPVP